MNLNIDKSIDYIDGYQFNKSNRKIESGEEAVPDGILSRIKFRDVEEIQNDLKEQIKNIIIKYTKNG